MLRPRDNDPRGFAASASLLMDHTQLLARLSSNPWTAIPFLFAAGVLTSLTPCIYPMIPITAAVVGGDSARRGAGTSRLRPVTMTLSYVVGLALVYATLGVLAGLTGTLFGSISSNPWSYFTTANLLTPLRPRHARHHPAPIADRAGWPGRRGGARR